MKTHIIGIMALCALPLMSCASSVDTSTVDRFDLNKYLGIWYEVARYDHSFEKGMDNTIAQYILQDDGTVAVINSGWKNGKYQVAEGKAKYPDPDGKPGGLKVSFFLFFYSEYNIMMVDENYQMSLVGSKKDNYLWILSRTPQLDDAVLGRCLEEAERRGYDTGNLIWVDQSMNY